MRRRAPRLPNPLPLSRPNFAPVYLIWELFLNRTLSGPRVDPESTCPGPPLPTLYLMRHTARKGFPAPTPTMAPTHSALFPLISRSSTPQRPNPFLPGKTPRVSPHRHKNWTHNSQTRRSFAPAECSQKSCRCHVGVGASVPPRGTAVTTDGWYKERIGTVTHISHIETAQQ